MRPASVARNANSLARPGSSNTVLADRRATSGGPHPSRRVDGTIDGCLERTEVRDYGDNAVIRSCKASVVINDGLSPRADVNGDCGRWMVRGPVGAKRTAFRNSVRKTFESDPAGAVAQILKRP